MVSEDIAAIDLDEVERGARVAEEDFAAGQPYASYHAWCSDSFKDGYALYLRFRRYEPKQTRH
jgi:hypothetical protein